MEKIQCIYKVSIQGDERILICSTADYQSRVSAHKKLLSRKSHGNKRLQEAYNLHGEAALSFEVLDLVDEKSNLGLVFNYHIALVGFDNLYNFSYKGRKLSEETKLKISTSKKGKKQSKKHILKRSKAVKQVCLQTGKVIAKFYSAKEAATKLGFNQGSISAVCRGEVKGKKHKGFGWEYV